MISVDSFLALPPMVTEARRLDLGSPEPGKLADVAIVDLRKPHLAPLAMVPQRLAYLASGQDVHTVIVDGKVVMRDRADLTADAPAIMRDAERAMWEMVERAGVGEEMGIPAGFWGSVRY